MTDTLAEQLRAFLNPKHADEAALRALLDAVPRKGRRRFALEARQRLDELERTFRPLSEYDGVDISGPDYPTATFTSEEQVRQIAAAIQTIRRKRQLLDAWADTWQRRLR
jgi:hypothetical protein